MNRTKRVISFLLVTTGTVVSDYAAYAPDFRPSPETCGAAITRSGRGIGKTLAEELACMNNGLKHVIFTLLPELLDIDSGIEWLKRKDIGYIIWQTPEKELDRLIHRVYDQYATLLLGKAVLYTKSPDYLCNAWLLFMQDFEPWEQVNHYLIGTLLEYAPDDIKYFYEHTFDMPRASFELDGASSSTIAKRITELLDPYAWARGESAEVKQSAADSVYENDKANAEKWLARMRPLCPRSV